MDAKESYPNETRNGWIILIGTQASMYLGNFGEEWHVNTTTPKTGSSCII